MLSVIHILSSLNVGGAERVTMELVQVQRAQGLDAQILSLGSGQDFLIETAQAEGIPVTVSATENSRWSRYREILAHVKKFDVVHVHSPRALIFIAPLVPLFTNTRVIYTRHGLEALASLKWKLLHIAMRPFIDYITFVAHSGRDAFMANHRWNKDKTRVVSNGVYVSNKPAPAVSRPVRFGSVGRMVELKGQPILLDAVAALAEKFGEASPEMFRLLFFGAGPMEPTLREQASKLPPGIVEFCGEVPDVDAIYEQIDVLVVASRSEGLSMVIMEAMARAKPAVATDVGGSSTLVKTDQTGTLVPYGDSNILCEAMEQLVNNTELVERYGQAAIELIRAEFSLENAHHCYLECYQG